MNHVDWYEIGDGLMAILSGPHVNGELDREVWVSNIGNATDEDVARALRAEMGDAWLRQSSWQSSAESPDLTSRWVRVHE